MFYWNNYNSKLYRNLDSDIMETKAFQISNVLVKSKGSPEDWNSDNVQVIGLAESDRILSTEKVSLLLSLPTNKTKKLLQTHNFNFSFMLKNADEEIILSYGENSSNQKRSISIRRYVTYNNENAIAEFNMWEER